VTEFQAIALVFAAASVVTIGTCLTLAALHATGAVYALAIALIIGLGADTCSRIGMRYESKRSGR
jgi:hypothetical protein